MDRVIVQGLEVWGRHGVLPEEQVLGQTLVVDMTVGCDLREAGRHDDLTAGISYVELVSLAREAVAGTRYQLLEAIAEHLAERVLQLPLAQEVTIRITKPRAPIPDLTGTVAIEIARKKG